MVFSQISTKDDGNDEGDEGVGEIGEMCVEIRGEDDASEEHLI